MVITRGAFSPCLQVLSVEDESTKLIKAVVLRDSWVDSPVSSGSYVHVQAAFSAGGQCIIDNDSGFLIVHPDHLVSATVVADSFKCIRRAVLQDRVKATNQASPAQIYGHILHEIFQEALKANRWDDAWLDDTISNIARRYVESLFEINESLESAVSHLSGKMKEMKRWADAYLSIRPGSSSWIRDRNGGKVRMSVNKLLEVEEHVWSPLYGLKGNVDATVQVSMEDGSDTKILTVPLELKTGKNTSNEAHRAQTALYTLLMSDRYDIEVAYGILYYLEASDMSRIPGIRLELVHMIMKRNELATYTRNRLDLPPMLKKERECKRCYAQTSCYVYHKLSENGDGETSGIGSDFVTETAHLLPEHQEFFKKWDDLLTKEEADLMKFRRELWTMTSAEREKVGRCFGQLVIEPGSAGEEASSQKINRYRYTFVRPQAPSSFSFNISQITTGEPIVVSDEQGHYALANGYVTSIRKDRITVAVDRRLHNARTRTANFDAHTNQSFVGVMEVGKASPDTAEEGNDTMLYRLDKDEFSNGMATVRNNLIRMMEKNLFGALPLRQLIIDKEAPRFEEEKEEHKASASQAHLNVDQMAAIGKVMAANDYALVLGMPGTGKTTTIAHIIRALVAQGKRVLLTSYTHTAVDNILLKLRDDSIGILRIGATAKVHPEVCEFADLAAAPKAATVAELERTYDSQVVATTCLGINHPIFNQRTFDYCIVDEASQITLPVCLGPIRMARRFILVGDHYQLPPLVQNRDALEGGLDVSLFKYLSDAHPQSVVTLEHQYRMNAEIMSLSNELIYNGRLKCGNDKVASRRISIPSIQSLEFHHHRNQQSPLPSTPSTTHAGFCAGPNPGSCWLHDAITPNSPVIFLNTDPIGDSAREQASGSRIVNEMEVRLTAQLVAALHSTGVGAQDMGVITLYRSQLALLRQELKSRSAVAADVEMHTADKYQGRDKEAIILSLVRSNDANNIGDLLKDWRRVNVALTRARTKLILVGSWSTMQAGNELLNHMCNFVQSRGWRYDLHKDACLDHHFEHIATQTSASGRAGAAEPTKFESKPKPKVGTTESMRPPAKHPGKKLDRKLDQILDSCGLRQPARRGKVNAKRLLGRRPVLENILQEMSPNVERAVASGAGGHLDLDA